MRRTQVLRCYDNRFQDTERNPSVHLNPKVFFAERKSVEVFRIFDVGTTDKNCRQFGEPSNGVDEKKVSGSLMVNSYVLQRST
jgi:esterase/lipase superfamily enzyme